jgi:serine phosphatase RsbU (regulator of sigma subunit)
MNRARRLSPGAGRRRTREENRVPWPCDRVRLDDERRALDRNLDHDLGRDRDGSRRVHRHAKLAVVGVGVSRVNVRNLNDRQQRQQQQAHDSRDTQRARLREAVLRGAITL